ncbi:MAG: chemotaxis response regulator protein-glutamate methylesterase [Zoogloeaceae bacterium]|jgi:two-component system chemotaxis response regulator CheB|nr:chemotaxis response regulator protein-glutamate methylesterase [Zoogloeaceae bacterium]
MAKTIKVMIVDDSILVRQVLSRMLASDPSITVIGTACDPIDARNKMEREWPDVLVLDIEMPRMDGISFLTQIMRDHPTPTIICSSLAEKGGQISLDALAAGAVSVISKPKSGVKQFLEDLAVDLCQSVHAAASANLKALLPKESGGGATQSFVAAKRAVLPPVLAPNRPKFTADVMLPLLRNAPILRAGERFVAIGTSTGGTQALEAVLTRLPEDTLGLVVVQHMPENFTGMFTQRLDGQCKIQVREARDGDRVQRGVALIAPGGKHMMVKRAGAQYKVEIRGGPPVSRHTPSVDVLFRSVANAAGPNALGVIMTGMGDDGAVGLKEMHEVGASTIAQDEATCVVFGMPKEAIKLGAADDVLPLDKIPEAIVGYTRNPK